MFETVESLVERYLIRFNNIIVLIEKEKHLLNLLQ